MRPSALPPLRKKVPKIAPLAPPMLLIMAMPTVEKAFSTLSGAAALSLSLAAVMPRCMPRPWSPSPRLRSASESMGSAAMMASQAWMSMAVVSSLERVVFGMVGG